MYFEEDNQFLVNFVQNKFKFKYYFIINYFLELFEDRERYLKERSIELFQVVNFLFSGVENFRLKIKFLEFVEIKYLNFDKDWIYVQRRKL